MSRKTQGQISVGDHVVLHGLDNEELNGSTARVLQECANEYDRFICYIESGRHERREYRVKSKNLAPIRERSKLFPDLDRANGEESDAADQDDENNDERKPRIAPQWSGDVKVIVTLRGINTKDEYKYNGRKARFLRNEGARALRRGRKPDFKLAPSSAGKMVVVRTLEQPGVKGKEVGP